MDYLTWVENDFISSLTNAVEMMYRPRNELVLLGDFDMNMLDLNDVDLPNRNLSEFCDKFCLQRQITQPTLVTNSSSTLTDVILSSHPERFAYSGILQLGISDHELIYAIRRNKLPTHVKTHKLLQVVCKQIVTSLFTSCQ